MIAPLHPATVEISDSCRCGAAKSEAGNRRGKAESPSQPDPDRARTLCHTAEETARRHGFVSLEAVADRLAGLLTP